MFCKVNTEAISVKACLTAGKETELVPRRISTRRQLFNAFRNSPLAATSGSLAKDCDLDSVAESKAANLPHKISVMDRSVRHQIGLVSMTRRLQSEYR